MDMKKGTWTPTDVADVKRRYALLTRGSAAADDSGPQLEASTPDTWLAPRERRWCKVVVEATEDELALIVKALQGDMEYKDLFLQLKRWSPEEVGRAVDEIGETLRDPETLKQVALLGKEVERGERHPDGRPKLVPIRRVGDRMLRNDPCPCGSGKKFKKCHGR